jgi:hypothetical protein
LRGKHEGDEIAEALAAARREANVPDEGAYASIAATVRDGRVLDFGPLFNPTAYFERIGPEDSQESGAETKTESSPQTELPDVQETHAERREILRQELRTLVSRVSRELAVSHKLVHATLNQRFGGPIATASLAGLEGRSRLVRQWIERRSYDGLK